jgi:hypothetical protein
MRARSYLGDEVRHDVGRSVVVLLAALHVEHGPLEDERGQRGERLKGEEGQHGEYQAEPGRRVRLCAIDGGSEQ